MWGLDKVDIVSLATSHLLCPIVFNIMPDVDLYGL